MSRVGDSYPRVVRFMHLYFPRVLQYFVLCSLWVVFYSRVLAIFYDARSAVVYPQVVH